MTTTPVLPQATAADAITAARSLMAAGMSLPQAVTAVIGALADAGALTPRLQDELEMRIRTGTEAGEPAPSWY